MVEFCPKSPMLDFIVNHSFFVFGTWISLIFIVILRGIHENVGRKNWNFGGIHGSQKKIETTWCPGWARGLRSGPRAQPGQQVVPISFLTSMNTTKISNFSAHIFVNTTQFYNKIMKSRSQKKTEWFTLKSNMVILDKILPPLF